MKTAKETIYEYVESTIYSNHEHQKGLETKQIAEALGIQRSNCSALLNELVKEGRLIKTETRPVFYRLKQQNMAADESASFTQLIGANESLRNAVKLAQAAILYPRTSLNVLLSSNTGCGTTYFASLMYGFAKEKGVLSGDAPYLKIDCRHYAKNIKVLDDEFFGSKGDLESTCFAKAKGGMLFIDHMDLLDARQQSQIFAFLDTGFVYSEDKSRSIDCKNVMLVLGCLPQNSQALSRVIPVTIELPELKDRTMRERFELINQFMLIEAHHSHRDIEMVSEAMEALLLCEYNYNVKGLELELQSACANAYVRVVNEPNQDIFVVLDDFKSSIQRSLLKKKSQEEELSKIIGDRESFVYSHDDAPRDDQLHNHDMYNEIKRQYDELTNLGINDTGIESVMNTHIQNLFKKYKYFGGQDDTNNLEQLSKIVDKEIITIVDRWLENTKKELNRTFKSNVFYGLCLHINSLLTLNTEHQRIDNDQIIEVIQEYPQEYAASVSLGNVLKELKGLELPIHEIVLIAMFLIENDEKNEDAHPVMLYIMHGNNTATSLRDVTNSLTHCHNSYSYDLALDVDTSVAMEEIKALIEQIDCGAGVIVIYDMGSIKTIIDTISEEIDIKVRAINFPITLLGIDMARKCSMETDVDYVYHMVNLEINKLANTMEKRHEVIVTLCHTGEGGAMQLKRYIDQYSKLAFKTIPLSVSSKQELLKEVMELKKTYTIHAFVGTFDPKLLGVPFISISKIFENQKEDLDRILMFEPIKSRTFDYEEIYRYLSDQFKYTSIAKLKSVLPDIIDELSLVYGMIEDQRIGLFMHIACLVERLQTGEQSKENNDKNKIISVFKEEYSMISKILKPLEKMFDIIIDDNELATIIMIIKKI